MTKLPKAHKFIDLSDYGRPAARIIAKSLKDTEFTPIHVTIGFIIAGLLAVACIIQNYFWAAGFFLIIKSILDAADGELARVKETPSYTGRYLDSVADIILNFLILLAIWFITESNILYTLLAFLGLQLQGTLYNYYYVILRNQHQGDTTSRIFEKGSPTAMEGEKQKHVDILYIMYSVLYSAFDKSIYLLDKKATKSRRFPNWLMTAVSTFGLGFQLLLISIMLIAGWQAYIIPFFVGYTLMIFLFIGIRRLL